MSEQVNILRQSLYDKAKEALPPGMVYGEHVSYLFDAITSAVAQVMVEYVQSEIQKAKGIR